jgi:hypothetical protein
VHECIGLQTGANGALVIRISPSDFYRVYSHGKHFAVFQNTLCHVFRPHGKKAISGSVIISTRYNVDIELPEMSSDQMGEKN